uniref:Etoposide-induced protein 2.4 n=1 Tax=Phlebotomus papatasi TaxID=29031 RepID=A0A1B0CYH4_PHLPP
MIFIATVRGCVDSIKGIAVVFYLDREMNKKLSSRSSRSQSTSNERLNQTGAPSTVRRSGINKEATKREEESKVWVRVLQCGGLNGGVFWASMVIFEYGILPVLKQLLTFMLSNESGFGMSVWGWMQPFLSLIFQMIWVLPLFLLTKIVNSLWFQDIADSAYKFRKGRPQLIPSISKLFADTLFSLIVQGLFLAQSMLVSLLPISYVGSILCFVHMSLLYSLYSFEYKWCNMGWELHKRLTYIEYNWPYFVGFGVPLAIVTQLPNSYISISSETFFTGRRHLQHTFQSHNSGAEGAIFNAKSSNSAVEEGQIVSSFAIKSVILSEIIGNATMCLKKKHDQKLLMTYSDTAVVNQELE